MSPADPLHLTRPNIYRTACIGVVLKGAATYHSGRGRTIIIPGTVVCGNPGEQFSCAQEDPLGNRRLVIDFAQSIVEDLAGELNLPRTTFEVPVIAPSPATALMFGWLDRIATGASDQNELVWLLAWQALCAGQLEKGVERPATEHDRARVLKVVRYIEANFDEPCSLKVLAELAGTTRFGLVRLFHQVIGQTPVQYVINTRLREAARLITATIDPITRIALDVGFNDISHFNATFRSTFYCSPLQWRRRQGSMPERLRGHSPQQ